MGIRELKDRLSEYLRQVRSGESVLVTDRGEVIAEMSPPGRTTVDAHVPPGLAALARRGMATLGAVGTADLYRRFPRKRHGRHTVTQLLDEERGSR